MVETTLVPKSPPYPRSSNYVKLSNRRNPADPKIYSNRAACYTKLMSFDLSLKDCEKAIELDPKFIKAYLRKANAQKGKSDIVTKHW